MTCTPIPGGYICGAGPHPTTRRILPCPTEGRRRRMVQKYGGLWYGDDLTCLGCGDAWADGERYARPFARGWRQKQIARARADWDRAVTRAEYDRHFQADLAAHVRFVDQTEAAS